MLQGQWVSARFLIPSWFLDCYPYKEQAEYIQGVLQELGIDVAIDVLEGGLFNEEMEKGNYDIAMRN